MAYIQDLCDDEDANIFFGTVIDPDMDGHVRVTVLATGFNPYTKEGRKAAEAAFGRATPTVAPQPVTPQATSADVVQAARDRIQQAAPLPQAPEVKAPEPIKPIQITPPAPRTQPVVPSEVIDETDLDVPAFIRKYKGEG